MDQLRSTGQRKTYHLLIVLFAEEIIFFVRHGVPRSLMTGCEDERLVPGTCSTYCPSRLASAHSIRADIAKRERGILRLATDLYSTCNRYHTPPIAAMPCLLCAASRIASTIERCASTRILNHYASPDLYHLRYNSTFSLPSLSSTKGQHSAGLVTRNRYSHFSGSEICVISFAMPQLKSTWTDRSGPFQHFNLGSKV